MMNSNNLTGTDLLFSGYAGYDPRMGSSGFVDRRLFPNAKPLKGNKMKEIPFPMPLFVITLRQPWASLIFIKHARPGFFAKMWETRSWKTKYRGPLMIHSSSKWAPEDLALCETPPFRKYVPNINLLPLGRIIGCVDLTKIMHTSDWMDKRVYDDKIHPDEIYFGNYEPGRYAWKLENPILCESLIECPGALSIWQYDPLTNKPTKQTNGKA